jgi:hypothetical protein
VLKHDDGSSTSNLDGKGMCGDGRIADGHSLLRRDIHVGQSRRRDWTFGQANDESSGFRPSRAQICDADVMKVRRKPGDRLRGVLVPNSRCPSGEQQEPGVLSLIMQPSGEC